MTAAPTGTRSRTGDGVGASAARPDGGLKVRGEFAFSSDLWMDGMLWGATLRSPHAHARITGIRTAAALAVPGVFRGLLDARASEITLEMLLRAAEAIALVVKDEELNPNFIIPSVFHPDVPKAVAAAIRGTTD